MRLEPPFRPATRRDCSRIAELFNLAGGGVPEYVWTSLSEMYPNLSPFEIGELRTGREDIPFSYRNTIIAERDGETAGIMISFPMDEEPEADPFGRADLPGKSDVITPFRQLELPGSYHISCVSLLQQHRGCGLGTRFLGLAREEARRLGHTVLSLLAFEENTRAIRLYERLGYRVVDSRPLVPDPLITYTGNLLLMTSDV